MDVTPGTCPGMTSAISLQESEAGAWPSNSQDTRTSGAGQEAARAPASPARGRGDGLLKTLAYGSGQSSTGSSGSAALQSSLGSRLKQQLGTGGSTLYRLTWRRRDTPQGGGTVCSVRRRPAEEGTAVVGRALPDARGERPGERQGDADALGRGEAGGLSDPHGEGLEGPARTGKKEQEPRPSRRGDDGRPGSVGIPSTMDSLPGREKLEQRRKGGGGSNVKDTVSGTMSNGSTSVTGNGGQLNRDLCRWLMGYPRERHIIRGFGNAIVPQVGAEFIGRSWIVCTDYRHAAVSPEK